MSANSTNTLSSAKRFFAATLAGMAAPLLVVTLLALCFGKPPTAALLLSLLPLSAMFSLLSVAPWFILKNEQITTRWFVSLLIPVGLAVDASALMMLLEYHAHASGANSGASAATSLHYDGMFVVANGIWAMVVSLAAAGLSHWFVKGQG
ncbi:hypothetical protein BH11CYA1_BH11CYA1_35760 [soil metagenome]